jgi:hypothetical protein
MTLIQRFNQLTIWNQLGAVGSVVGIVSFACWLIFELPNSKPPTKQVTQTAINSPNSVQIAGNVIVNPDPKLEIQKNLRQHIRTLLAEANPEILERIDSGAPNITVFLSQKHMNALSDFSEFPEFTNYLAIISNHSVITGGSSNHIGDGINDKSDEGTLNGFVLYIKDPLRTPQ